MTRRLARPSGALQLEEPGNSPPIADLEAARRIFRNSILNKRPQPSTARSGDDDSERSERSSDVGVSLKIDVEAPGRPLEPLSVRTYGDVLADDPLVPRASWAQSDEDARRASRSAQLETFRTNFPERDQLGTYFTISDGDVLQAVLADDPRAHFFRHAVARELEKNWSTRAVALMSCGEAGARCDCQDCGAPHVLPYRCGARSCPTCARTASAIKCEKIAQLAKSATDRELLGPWDGIGPAKKKQWRTLHMTTAAKKTEDERYDPAVLKAYVDAVRKAWGPFWRSTPWGARKNDVSKRGKATKRVRRDTLGAIGIEVGDGGMVHLHAAIYGEYVDSAEIARLWKAACEFGGFIKIRLMRSSTSGELLVTCDSDGFRDALREVLKYVTKGHKAKNLLERAPRAAAVEYALRSQRRVETCGALRLVPSISEKDLATEQQSCTVCGVAGAWKWRGVRAPSYVRKNNGFGFSRIVDDVDAEITKSELLDYMRRVLPREREPGGMFYGGAPPPWIDDVDEWETTEIARR